jgi:hypothetical protein
MARVTQTLVDTVTIALRKIIQYKIKINDMFVQTTFLNNTKAKIPNDKHGAQ